MKKTAFVSDFDGTITDDDFFSYTTRAYFDEEALSPWHAYFAGTKTHFQALKEMFAQLRVPEDELKALISKIRLDPFLDETWKLCKKRNIPLYVCSAGNDYYIRQMVGKKMKEYGVTLVANRGEYDPARGLEMTSPPEDSPYYDEKTGVSKYKLVQKLKDEGYFVIFAGDGPPDFEPAKIADAIFAKKILLQKCISAGIPTLRFNDFADIFRFVKGL